MGLKEYGGRLIETDGLKTVELIDPNDNARRRFQYRATPGGGIECRALRSNGKPFIDTGSPWEPCDVSAMERVRGDYHPVLDELTEQAAPKNETLIIRQIPADLKRAFKVKCAAEGISLQAQMIELMRRWVEEK